MAIGVNRGIVQEDVTGGASFSVIIPVYNEERNVRVLYDELNSVLRGINKKCELVFIDDGSIDGTPEILRQLGAVSSNIGLKIIILIKRVGQSQAIQAGIDNSEGALLVLLDGDLQNDPKDIPLLLDKLDEGWDMVNGWRKDRKDPFFSKRLPSLAANKMIRCISKVDLHDFGCSLKAFRRGPIKDDFLLGSIHRLLPLWFAMRGYRVTEAVVAHRKRINGKSKYGFKRIYELILELCRINFFEKHFYSPLHYFGIFALALVAIGLGTGIFVILRKIILGGVWVSPLLFISLILFSLGMQVFFIGLVAEVLVRI